MALTIRVKKRLKPSAMTPYGITVVTSAETKTSSIIQETENQSFYRCQCQPRMYELCAHLLIMSDNQDSLICERQQKSWYQLIPCWMNHWDCVSLKHIGGNFMA